VCAAPDLYHKSLRELFKFYAAIRKEHFDLVLCPLVGRGLRIAAMVWFSGARWRIGFSGFRDSVFFNLKVPYPTRGREAERNFGLVQVLDPGLRLEPVQLQPRPEQVASVRELLGSMAYEPGRPLVVMHPGGKWATKQWLPERYAAVADTLAERYRAQIAFTGTEPEKPLVETVRQHMRIPALDLCDRLTIGRLAGLLSLANLLISVDTGVAHLAVALRCPTVALFGSGDPAQWGYPQSEEYRVIHHPMECWPCYHPECPRGQECMRAITVDEVLAAVDQIGKLAWGGRK